MALVSNVRDRDQLSRRAARLLDGLESLGVEMLFAEYRHRPASEEAEFASSRYLFDAIEAACEICSDDARVWLTDVDCVWLDPARVMAAAGPSPSIGCIHIPYPPDWDLTGFSPVTLGDIAAQMGGPTGPVPWVGGELIAGTAAGLRVLLATCEALEQRMAERELAVVTEEHVLSLAEALGLLPFHDLTHVAQRIWTGPRHGAPPVEEPGRLGLWHLPSEKGLGFRRGANEILAGREARLAADLADPVRAMSRFNVAGAPWTRRVRDDAWLAAQRLRAAVGSRGR
ncbi:MAG TPA: hypothetical protein VII01_13825 [Solirubrobacteraceae bacterium]|jgi:hypothetical protein